MPQYMFSAWQPPIIPARPKICILGDSITANNTSGTPYSSPTFNANGYMTWLNIFSRQLFEFQPLQNFGHIGDTIAQIAARVPNVIDENPTFCIVLAGTNDVANGSAALPYMKQIYDQQILEPLENAGIIPIIMPILPRTGITADQYNCLMGFNNWLNWTYNPTVASLTPQVIGPDRYKPIYVDAAKYFADLTTGNAGSGYTPDGLHPNAVGAFIVGWALWQKLKGYFPEVLPNPDLPLNAYDGSANPQGNCLFNGTSNPYGAMLGTGGGFDTVGGFTPTGQIATGWQGQRVSGATSTGTQVFFKENPRQDIPMQFTGERQGMTVNITGAGTGLEAYRMYANQGQFGINAGDYIYGEVGVSVTQWATGFAGFFLQLINGVTGTGNPTAAGASGGNLLASLPGIGWDGVIRTPIIQVPGNTAPWFSIDAVFDSTVSGAGGTVYFSDAKIIKVPA